MMMILAIVPNPGRCLSGIHPRRTTTLMKNVDHPKENGECLLKPWESTTQGEFPRVDWISRDSPRPKIVKPKARMRNRDTLIDQGVGAVQLVRGMVLCGLSKSFIFTKG
jgi:hypothetical protein